MYTSFDFLILTLKKWNATLYLGDFGKYVNIYTIMKG